jgi:hypothetical protein
VTNEMPDNQAEHTLRTREAYDRLAAVWSSTTDEGPFNGFQEASALETIAQAAARTRKRASGTPAPLRISADYRLFRPYTPTRISTISAMMPSVIAEA